MAHGKTILGSFAIFAWIAFTWTAPTGAEATSPAQPALPNDSAPHEKPVPHEKSVPGQEPVYEVVPQLEPPTDECLERWSEALGEPSQDERSWRDQLNHGIYRIGIGETQLARIELLSSASPAACEADPDWRKRQTQLLVTYFLADGTTEEVLYEFLEDEVYYNQSPQIHAAGGVVVLQGVVYDGSDVQITLELDLLRELYDAAAAPGLDQEKPSLRASTARSNDTRRA